MRKLIFGAFLALFALAANAAQVDVRWELPTSRVDGTPLPVSELASTVIEYGTCTASSIGSIEGTLTAAAPATTVVFERAAGEVCVRAKSVDTAGRQSDWSGVARAVIPSDAAPNAPVILQITWLPAPPQNYVAYTPGQSYSEVTARKLVDGRLVYGDATVKAGVPCNCTIAKLEIEPVVWCDVSGQLQQKYGSRQVARLQPLPAGYMTPCRPAA